MKGKASNSTDDFLDRYLQDRYSPCSELAIASFEKRLVRQLPGDYRAFLLRVNGGVFRGPVENAGGLCVDRLWGLGTGFDWCDLGMVNDVSAKWLPADCLSIGMTGGGSELCIALFQERFGAVLTWDRDIEPAVLDWPDLEESPSFRAFLDSLQLRIPDDEVEPHPAFSAILNDDKVQLEKLLRAGLDPATTNHDGMTLLGYAVYRCRLSALDLLSRTLPKPPRPSRTPPTTTSSA